MRYFICRIPVLTEYVPLWHRRVEARGLESHCPNSGTVSSPLPFSGLGQTRSISCLCSISFFLDIPIVPSALCSVRVIPNILSTFCSVSFTLDCPMFRQRYSRYSISFMFRQLYSGQPDVPSVLCSVNFIPGSHSYVPSVLCSVNFIPGSQRFIQPYVPSTLFCMDSQIFPNPYVPRTR